MASGEEKAGQLRPYTYADVIVWALKILVAMGTGLVLANAAVWWYMGGW